MKEPTPFLSVVVLALNEEPFITQVLSRIASRSGLEQLELIVVDGGSTDRTVSIASRFGSVVNSPPGRATQMNRGLREASGQVVLFCHGDTILPVDFGYTVQVALQDPGVVGGAFRPIYRPAHPVLTGLSWVLRLDTPYLMFGDQAMFARSSVLKGMGGVPRLPLMEDVALALALSKQGTMIRLRDQVETSSRRFLEHGVFRQLILDIRLLLAYHLFRISPADLAARYRVTARDQTLDPDRRGVMVGVMAKAPLPGHAKTRLGKDLGKEQALAIYGLILKNTLNKLEKLPVGFHPLLLAAGKRDQAWFQEHYPGWQIKRQVGGTLGDRLQKASEQMFLSDAQKVILVAADVPDVGVSEVLDAARGLDEANLILGPSPDGGYYLIGIDQPYPELFQDIRWGGERVLEQTRAKAQFLGLKIQMLSPLMDIDTGRDWKMHQNENF